MRSGQASHTAAHNTLFRALEFSFPPDVRLFDDSLAQALLPRPLAGLRPAIRLPGGAKALSAIIDHRWPGVRTSLAARTRLIDDTLAALPPDRLGQLVILGAGFDTRPYRLQRLRSVPVFEIDHPDTQAAKRAALRRTLEVPDNVTFVPIDFNTQTLADTMTGSGYRPDLPTVFLWEGTTNYLTEPTVDATLRWCVRTAAAGSLLLLTYVHADVLRSPESFVGGRRLRATLDKVGERFTFGKTPEDMRAYLAERGLELEWDCGAAEYRARYFGERARTMAGHEFYRVALAHIAAPL